MKTAESLGFVRLSKRRGFTLAEVLIAMAISMLSLAGIIYGYIGSCKRAEWSAYSMAAESLAMQRLEQTRASKWDLDAFPQVDELIATNFPIQTNILDVPASGTNITWATCTTVITMVSATPPLKQIRVDCVWQAKNGRWFTNTVVTYRGADN